MTIRAKNHGAMQIRRERGDVEMPSLEIPSFIFIYQVERCQVTRLTPPLLSSSSKQNPSFYRITRFSFFFFPLHHSLLTHPVCTKKQKEIFKGISARFCTELESFILLPRYLRKTSAQTFAGETNPVSSMRGRLRATFNRDTRPFLLRLFRGKRKIAET